MRHWGKISDNEVRRTLDKKDIRRLKKGKEVRIRVQGLFVVLTNKDYINPNQKEIDRLEAKINQLKAKIKEVK